MADSPTVGLFNPSPLPVAEEPQSEPTPITSEDLRIYIMAFWTSLPPLIEHGSNSAQKPFNVPNHYDKQELEKFYNAFIRDCAGIRSHTADIFEDTFKRTKCYPWQVTQHDAGYAWYVALAIAALEVDEFSAGKNESIDDRFENAKKKVSEDIRGQKSYLDLVFQHARGVALRKDPVEK